jgi:hypothetical protein
VEHAEWDPERQYRLISPGVDRRFGTPDDLIAYLEVRSGDIGAVAGAVTVAAIPQRIRVGGNARFFAQDGARFQPGIGGVGINPLDAVAVGNAQAVLIEGGLPPPPPQAARAPMAMVSMGAATAKIAPAEIEPAPRVRSYFAEALYINPEIITDRDGRASIAVPLGDSITT